MIGDIRHTKYFSPTNMYNWTRTRDYYCTVLDGRQKWLLPRHAVMPSSRDSMRTVSFHKNDFQISDIMISRAVMSWVTRTSRNKQTRRPDRVNGSEPQSTRTSDPPTVAKENINLSISATFVFSFTALSSPSHAFPTCFSSVAAAKFLATTVHTSTPVHSNV